MCQRTLVYSWLRGCWRSESGSLVHSLRQENRRKINPKWIVRKRGIIETRKSNIDNDVLDQFTTLYVPTHALADN